MVLHKNFIIFNKLSIFNTLRYCINNNLTFIFYQPTTLFTKHSFADIFFICNLSEHRLLYALNSFKQLGGKKKYKNFINKQNYLFHSLTFNKPNYYNYLAFTDLTQKESIPQKLRAPFNFHQRNFLTKNRIESSLFKWLYFPHKLTLEINFLTKNDTSARGEELLENRNRGNTVLLTNTYKRLAWKFHLARIIHWNLRTKGKLNEWRYNKLLAIDLKAAPHNMQKTLLGYTLLILYTTYTTWKNILQLLDYRLIIKNGTILYPTDTFEKGDIVELPFFWHNSIEVRLEKKFLAIYLRAKKFSFKLLSRTKKPTKIDKISNKIFKRMPIFFQDFGNLVHCDQVFKSIFFLNPLSTFHYNCNASFNKTSILTLQNWRYRFD